MVGPLASAVRHHTVTILGEIHGHPDSPALLTALVDRLTRTGGCLTVALEIGSDQNPVLQQALSGQQPVARVRISPIIDQPAYRTMLVNLGRWQRAGRCLQVHAIDEPAAVAGNRDVWMARQLGHFVGPTPVLALLGDLHALRQVHWTSGRDDPFVAERLIRHGIAVFSVIQRWPGHCRRRRPSLYASNRLAAQAAIQATLSLAAVVPPSTVASVADGVVIWRCH